MTTAAPATQRCRVCGVESPGDATRCRSCTAALGEQPPCPHCRAIAGTSPNAEFRYVCDVCGGPRVPAVRGVTASGRAARALAKAERARKSRAGYRALTIGASAPAVLLPMLLGLAALLAGSTTILLGGVLVAVPFVLLALFGASRARAAGRVIPPAIDEAWVASAHDFARARGGAVKAADIAASFGVDEAAAEELVAELDVDAAIGVADAPPTRARIASTPSTTDTEGDAAVAEAEAEAEAIANEAARGAAKR